jgi:hypothetical protein
MPDKKNLKDSLCGCRDMHHRSCYCICGGIRRSRWRSRCVFILSQPVTENVLFQHAVHLEEYGYSCTDCHHAIAGKSRQAGGFLRIPAMKAASWAFRRLARTGLFDHDMHSYDFGLSCMDCHHEMNDFGMDPQRCSDCHRVRTGTWQGGSPVVY